MNGNASLIVAAMATALSWTAPMQIPEPVVRVTIEPSAFARGAESTVTVLVEIPEGRFVPAETGGALQGAWLQPTSLGFPTFELPTYPLPAEVRLPGADRPMLAYSGTLRIQLPVWAAAGLRGRRDFGVRFGHQLCDSSSCRAMTIASASLMVDVGEPSLAEGSLAFRVDGRRVAIPVAGSGDPDEQLGWLTPMARFAQRVALLPNAHPARRVFDQARPGVAARWTIASSERQFSTTTGAAAALRAGCEDAMPLAWIGTITDPSFATERSKYFLAWPDDAPLPAAATAVPSAPTPLTDSERLTLESLIDRQMRVTLPTVLAPDPAVSGNNLPRQATEYERRITRGEGRRSYHLEILQLSPDHQRRLYVRAYWSIGGHAPVGLTLWIRSDGRQFVVERTDASISTFSNYAEGKSMGPDIAARPEYAGTLLNVIPAADGWSYLIMGAQRYESFGVSVYKYSALGPQATNITYGHGC